MFIMEVVCIIAIEVTFMNPLDYEKLNLSAGANLDEVKHRYDMLMKRSLRDESVDVEGITKAYDNIIAENKIDYFDGDAELLKANGINRKKVRNFIFQNKLRIGFIVWILFCIGIILYILFFQAGNITLMPNMVPY